RLDDPARAALLALGTGEQLQLVTSFPSAVLRLLGLGRAVEIVAAAADGSGYARIAALAALCPVAEPASRAELAELAAQIYFDDWDTDALELVVGLSAWLSSATASRLYVGAAGVVADSRGLCVALQGWGGVEQLAP